MNQPFRLAQGGRVDRRQPVRFTFNGKTYQGFAGDTLASALLANGVRLVARSWKYHRPRGIITAGVEEPNAVVQVGSGARTVPNVLATTQEIYEGFEATSVNCRPSVENDRMAFVGRFSRFLPAGFYYKTFMWPASLWMKYEHYIRRAAGLGESPRLPDPDRYEKVNLHCDVVIAGGGPAGLAAALAAGRTGARVVLADEQAELGGSLLASKELIDGMPALDWVAQARKELAAMPEVQVLTRSTVFGYHDHNFLTIQERLTDHLSFAQRRGPRERIWRVRAKEVVLATGAHERPLVFGDNDLPGVMLASAVSIYLHRFAVAPGRKAVLFTNNDSVYQTALDLLNAGVEVAAVVDARARVGGLAVNRVRERGVEVIANAVVVRALGRGQVSGAEVMRLDGERVTGSGRVIACDLLAVSGGFSPVLHLSAHSGAKAVWDDTQACFLPGKPIQRERSAGACKGTRGLGDCLAEGSFAGAQAARQAGFGDGSCVAPEALNPAEERLRPLWLVPSPQPVGRGAKQFVDFQNDVAASDIHLAAREGYHSIEHVKRYTALGFGTDQGKLGNINGMAILAQALGRPISDTGTTTFRPNYTPVTFGAVAGPETGELFDPVRKSAIHPWHLANRCPFENVGQWHRPWFFPKKGEALHDAVQRESRDVRRGVGIMDASTLGKIDIQGPDAGKFLNMLYTNAFAKLEVGKCRYGLMLDENGMVMDDGVTSRLGENHFLMTTTTGGAARVMSWMERWLQTEWPELKVYLTSVTDHWATMAVVGPDSRKVLQGVCQDIDFAAEAFPFMSFRKGTVAGVKAMVNRISFSGELAYEINVPADYAHGVWKAVMQAGAAYDITPYGTETMHVLRAEKGFIIVGQDTDGSVTPIDLGMDWVVAKNKDFLGKRSLFRADTARNDRKHLVGLYTDDPQTVLPEGGQIVEDPRAPAPVPMLGHVTSSYFSPTLNRSIAMAMVKNGRNRQGQRISVPLASGKVITAVIGSSVFYDSEGARQNV